MRSGCLVDAGTIGWGPRAGLALGAVMASAGCGGPQSALAPAGRDAAEIAELFRVMAVGAAIVWIAVIGLTLYATRFGERPHGARVGRLLIVGGGVVAPTVVLTALLLYGLAPMPRLLALPPAGGLTIAVTGEQWWWRVRYEPPAGRPFELANEIRLPVGERIELRLASADVIHSFWVPSIAGKMDMIPGRVTRLALEPTRTGTFTGACAEYCGTSHGLMRFHVVVMERAAFDRWLEGQRQDAAPPAGPVAARGRTSFLAHGCGACHTIRGTGADGVIGPDLTHVGSRVGLAAGVLPNTPDDLRHWIAATERVKPGVHMPAFNMLGADDLAPLATYLSELR